MAGLKTLACCLLIVVFIHQEAHSRVVNMETVFEVEAETFEMKSLQSFGPKVCKVIDGHNVCAAALAIKLPPRLTVLITVDGEDFMSLYVSNGHPPPKCEFVAKYGNVCVTIDSVDLENLKGCAKISALTNGRTSSWIYNEKEPAEINGAYDVLKSTKIFVSSQLNVHLYIINNVTLNK